MGEGCGSGGERKRGHVMKGRKNFAKFVMDAPAKWRRQHYRVALRRGDFHPAEFAAVAVLAVSLAVLFLVALSCPRDLLLCAKHLFVEAITSLGVLAARINSITCAVTFAGAPYFGMGILILL